MDANAATLAQPVAEPNPQLIWDTINAYQRTEALRGAIELKLFTAIGEGSQTVKDIAARCKASERGIRILCDYLTVIGFLRKEGNHYQLTPDSAVFLDQRSPAYLGSILRFINSRDLMSGFDDVAGTVRQGTTLMTGAGTVDPEDPVWVEFAQCMVPLVMTAADFIGQLASEISSGPLKVLDIAAGHGMFGISIARRNPQANIVALDWPKVLDVAKGNATAAGVQDRYRCLPGDAFTVDFGTGFDLVLITNLFHHFTPPECTSLMRKIAACLKPSGRAITLEFIPNEDRISPPIPASFSLMMLGSTPAGDAYTFSEYDRMFRDAGFARSEIMQVPKAPQQLMVTYRQ